MHVVIVGSGRLGAGLARMMSLHGHQVVVVDRDPEAFRRLGPGFKGKTVTGVGFDRDVLHSAGIEHTDALAAVTDSDEVNVVTARIARRIYRVPKVVARLYDPGQAEAYERLGVQTIAPISWGVGRIAGLLEQSGLDIETTIGTSDANLVVIEAPSILYGQTMNLLTIPGEIQAVAITRNGKTFLPSLGTVIRPGDQIHLAVLATSMIKLDRMLNQVGG